MKKKQVVKVTDLFRGKCIYARMNQDAESLDVLREVFNKGLEQLQEKRIIFTSKQAVAIHFKFPEEAKSATKLVRSVQCEGGFRLTIL